MTRTALQAAAAVAGAGMVLVVGLDGSVLWSVVRVLLLGAVVALVIAAARRGAWRAAAGSALAVGLVATAVGAATGFPYLGTVGWSAKGVGGVAALAGGVAMLVAGAVLFFRSVRGWGKRLAAVPIGLALAYAVGLPVAVSVYATNVPRPGLDDETPADRGLSYTDASFVTSDGVTLSGWYVPSTGGAAVVLLHGASSTRSNVLDHAVVLADHGYGVLLFDARGMGRSGGRAMNFGWYGDRDIAAAVSWLEQQPGVDAGRIGAVGMSMGGEEAIGAIAADERIRAVVAEGATGRDSGDLAWLDDEYGLRGRLQRGVGRLQFALTDAFSAAPSPVTLRTAVAQAAPRPALLIAAGDVEDEAHAGEYIRSGSPESVQLWVVEGAGHTDGLVVAPDEWEQRVTTFLDQAFGGAR